MVKSVMLDEETTTLLYECKGTLLIKNPSKNVTDNETIKKALQSFLQK